MKGSITNAQKVEELLCLAGIEFNIEILIIVILWIYDLKIAFWVLLFFSITGILNKLGRIMNLK